jgi:hypothetical protein
VAYNFQIGNNGIKLLTEYENAAQKVLFDNDMFAELISWRKYNVMPQNGDCSEETMCVLRFCNGNPDNNVESSCLSHLAFL